MQHTLILCPFYNEAASFQPFAAAVQKVMGEMEEQNFSFLLVDDGSNPFTLNVALPLTVLHLHRNVGHQKAIAVGLAYAQHHMAFDRIIVMDADGEDRPEDIPKLLNAETGKIVVAKRASRGEGWPFRFFYVFYKLLFRLLTGKTIDFGNFMLLPKAEVARIVHYSEIWSHLAGTVIKSKMGFTAVDTHRGKRLHGASKMNFTALLLHGLGAIGVFIEVTATRLLLFSTGVILLSLLVIVAVFIIKLFTDLAIPGWATNVVSFMLIMLLQSFLLSLFTIFLYLSSQSQRKFIPAHHYAEYVQSAVKQS